MNGSKSEEIFGLILAGGKSSRMGQDKSQLTYGQKPQFQSAYELLQGVCAQVFISSRLEQKSSNVFGNYPLIVDLLEYEGQGPLAGILTAMKMFPKAAWLVLACDLPFVSGETIRYLIAHRNSNAIATAFRSEYDDLPEPLCAIWEPGHAARIQEFFNQGIQCPRKVLIKCQAHLCAIQVKGELDNINNPTEVAEAWARLQNQKR